MSNNPFQLPIEVQFEIKRIETQLRESKDAPTFAEDVISMICELYRQNCAIKQFFKKEIGTDSNLAASLRLQNESLSKALAEIQRQTEELKNHLRQKEAINQVLLADIEALKEQNSMLKGQKDFSLKVDCYKATWIALREAILEMFTLMKNISNLKEYSKLDENAIDWQLNGGMQLLGKAANSLPKYSKSIDAD